MSPSSAAIADGRFRGTKATGALEEMPLASSKAFRRSATWRRLPQVIQRLSNSSACREGSRARASSLCCCSSFMANRGQIYYRRTDKKSGPGEAARRELAQRRGLHLVRRRQRDVRLGNEQ